MRAKSLLDDLEIEGDDLPHAQSERPMREERGVRGVIEVPLSQIVAESSLQTREINFDPQRYVQDAELLASVQRFGVIEPVLVQRMSTPLGEPSRFSVIFGNRRVGAARAAGRRSVPALLSFAEGEDETLTIAENSGRRELTPYEKALLLQHLKERSAGISTAELAAMTGWPQPTVYSLLAAYEKSAPTLRRIFAEGQAGTRMIQSMQPIFDQVPASAHEELAALLAGRTHAEIEAARTALQTGEDPLEVLRAMRSSHGASPIVPSGLGAPQIAREPSDLAETQSPTGRTSQFLDTGNTDLVREIAEISGASRAAVARLMHGAIAMGLPYEVLVIACHYTGRGGKEEAALRLSQQAFARRKATGILLRTLRHLGAVSAARRWVAALPNVELQQFFNILLGG